MPHPSPLPILRSMERTTVVLVTLCVYVVALLALGVLAQRRTASESDFLLGGRGLSGFVAGISASASSSSVWTLLGVSGYAYLYGLKALWLFPACVGGFVINWFLVAPRLRRMSAQDGSLTVIELLAGRHRGPAFAKVRVLAVAVLAFSLTVYVASQFRGAGDSLATTFDIGRTPAILCGAGVVLLYTVVGGLWAVSLTDTVQGSMMALAAITLPIACLVAVGGPVALADGIATLDAPGYADLFHGESGFGAVLGVLTLLGIGIGYPGQPHVVNFFMATRDESALRSARVIALCWAVCVYAGMIVVGLSGRVLHRVPLENHEQAFLQLAQELFPSAVSALMLASVMSAIMSTADSQLLVVGSAVSRDLLPKGRRRATPSPLLPRARRRGGGDRRGAGDHRNGDPVPQRAVRMDRARCRLRTAAAGHLVARPDRSDPLLLRDGLRLRERRGRLLLRGDARDRGGARHPLPDRRGLRLRSAPDQSRILIVSARVSGVLSASSYMRTKRLLSSVSVVRSGSTQCGGTLS